MVTKVASWLARADYKNARDCNDSIFTLRYSGCREAGQLSSTGSEALQAPKSLLHPAQLMDGQGLAKFRPPLHRKLRRRRSSGIAAEQARCGGGAPLIASAAEELLCSVAIEKHTLPMKNKQKQ